MKNLYPSDKVYVAASQIKNAGRGVFAAQAIKKGELIERCPVIEVSKNDTSNLTETILVTYFFYFGKNKEKALVALGFGSIYNHTFEPNAVYKITNKNETMDFIALKDIKNGEEITVNYNSSNPNDKTSLWFQV